MTTLQSGILDAVSMRWTAIIFVMQLTKPGWHKPQSLTAVP
jgi:hypothetical protein